MPNSIVRTAWHVAVGNVFRGHTTAFNEGFNNREPCTGFIHRVVVNERVHVPCRNRSRSRVGLDL